jgi:hypothetical protein
MPQPSRFDYVKYDEKSISTQELAKRDCQFVEQVINMIECPKSKAYALKALEEAYMWIGKGIRNDQIKRSGEAELQEERKDG